MNPRKFDVKLVTKGNPEEGPMAYGGTPEQFADAPFKVALVQRGWHCDSDCVDFWVR